MLSRALFVFAQEGNILQGQIRPTEERLHRESVNLCEDVKS